jgi:hypothetical protein
MASGVHEHGADVADIDTKGDRPRPFPRPRLPKFDQPLAGQIAKRDSSERGLKFLEAFGLASERRLSDLGHVGGEEFNEVTEGGATIDLGRIGGFAGCDIALGFQRPLLGVGLETEGAGGILALAPNLHSPVARG